MSTCSNPFEIRLQPVDSCVLGDGRTMRVGDVVWGGVESGSVAEDFEGRHSVTWWPGKVRNVQP